MSRSECAGETAGGRRRSATATLFDAERDHGTGSEAAPAFFLSRFLKTCSMYAPRPCRGPWNSAHPPAPGATPARPEPPRAMLARRMRVETLRTSGCVISRARDMTLILRCHMSAARTIKTKLK